MGADSNYLVKIQNVSNFTGNEFININRKLENIHKESFRFHILTDIEDRPEQSRDDDESNYLLAIVSVYGGNKDKVKKVLSKYLSDNYDINNVKIHVKYVDNSAIQKLFNF